MYRIGVDLGGTNIVAGVVDEFYKIVGKGKMPTACPRPAVEILSDVAKAVEMAIEDAGITLADVSSIGIGTPGSVEKHFGIIQYANNLGFSNVPARKILQSHFDKPIYIENDANCAALGEAAELIILLLSHSEQASARVLLLTAKSSAAVTVRQAKWVIWLFVQTVSFAPAEERAVGRLIPRLLL